MMEQAQLNELKEHIAYLENENKKLTSEKEMQDCVINECRERIKFLEGQIEAYQYVVCSRR